MLNIDFLENTNFFTNFVHDVFKFHVSSFCFTFTYAEFLKYL